MKKIPSLFLRDDQGNLTDEYHPKAAWVVGGEGVATRKWDGTAVAVIGGKLHARYDCKSGKQPPAGFVPCQDPDPITGHWPGWVLADRPGDKWIREAAGDSQWQDGTYEACGPKIGANAEGLTEHTLIRHGACPLLDAPRNVVGLRSYLAEHDIEGIVWWRDIFDVNCDKVKITGPALGVGKRAGKR